MAQALTTTTLTGLRPSLLMAPLRLQELSPALQKYHSIPYFNAKENVDNEKMTLPDSFTVVLTDDAMDVDVELEEEDSTWPPIVAVKEIHPDSSFLSASIPRSVAARRNTTIPSVHTPPPDLWKINQASPAAQISPPTSPTKRSGHPIAPPGLNLHTAEPDNLPLLFTRFSTDPNSQSQNADLQATSLTPTPIGFERGRARFPKDSSLSLPERQQSRFTFAQPMHTSPLVYSNLMQRRQKLIASFAPVVPSPMSPNRMRVSVSYYARKRMNSMPLHKAEQPSVYTRDVHTRSRTFCDKPLAHFSHRQYVHHGNTHHCIDCSRDTLHKRLLTSLFYTSNPSYFPGQQSPSSSPEMQDLRAELEDVFEDDGIDFDRQWSPASPRLPDFDDFDFEAEDSDDDAVFSPGKSYLDLSIF